LKIAINCRYLRKHPEGIGWYLYEMLVHWLTEHQEHEYHLLFDQEPEINFPDCNYQVHIIPPQTSNILSIARWSMRSIHRWLEEHKPDVFYSPDGFCPLRKSVKTVISVHDLAPLAFPGHMYLSARWFYRLFQKRMIRNADHVITVSEFSKREIIKHAHVSPKQVSVVYNGVRDVFQPASELQVEEIRNKYKLTKPYFLYYGSIHPRKNVISVIRAFEHYKSHGGTHQLVISGRFAWKTKQEKEALSKSPAREDIIQLDYLAENELVPLITGSAALLYLSTYEGFGLPVLEAMACGTLVVTSEKSAMSEFSADAAILTNPHKIENISLILENIEKKPNLYALRSPLGLKISKSYSWGKAAGKILQRLITV
jgi:glycosyltransferase involved in cell wall biosynthesis